MRNKIIINGVDVSGCAYYKDNECRCEMLCYHIEDGKCITEPEMLKRESHATYGTCSLNPDCYYKQSARKDERIRELEVKNKRLEHFYKHLTRQGENLTASQRNYVTTIGQSIGADIYIDENRDLKQKLSQIVELANQIINISDKPACVHEPECPSNGGIGYDNHCHMTCPFIIAQQIKHIAQGE